VNVAPLFLKRKLKIFVNCFISKILNINKMSTTSISVCSLVVMVAAVALTVLAFMHIFRRAHDSENDLNVIQRQLRGFAVLMVAQLVMVLGAMVCAGTLLPSIMEMIKK